MRLPARKSISQKPLASYLVRRSHWPFSSPNRPGFCVLGCTDKILPALPPAGFGPSFESTARPAATFANFACKAGGFRLGTHVASFLEVFSPTAFSCSEHRGSCPTSNWTAGTSGLFGPLAPKILRACQPCFRPDPLLGFYPPELSPFQTAVCHFWHPCPLVLWMLNHGNLLPAQPLAFRALLRLKVGFRNRLLYQITTPCSPGRFLLQGFSV